MTEDVKTGTDWIREILCPDLPEDRLACFHRRPRRLGPADRTDEQGGGHEGRRVDRDRDGSISTS